jgi:homoserine kinase
MSERIIKVRVPGTSANCGPGFDTLGVACTIYNELALRLQSEPGLDVHIEGEGAANIPHDDRNIVWRSIVRLLREAGRENEFKGASIWMDNKIPLSRGLGSSAAAIVAGLKAANVLLDNRFNRYELLQLANEIEGHPDNVAPAIFGGFTISINAYGKLQCYSFLPKLKLKLVVAIPDFPLSTRVARNVLPAEIPMQDAVFNIGRTGMLVAALCRGNTKFLRHAFEDKLHQPYRTKLIPGMKDVFRAAHQAGALGASLSGAGPCLMAFTDKDPDRVGKAMTEAFQRNKIEARYLVMDIDGHGAAIVNRH